MNLRPYQSELVAAVKQAIREEMAKGNKHPRILVVLPTGGGKTVVGTHFMAGAEAKGNPSIFLAPRRELVYQTAARLQRFGIAPGLIMAGEAMHRTRLCQVASFDTLHARAVRSSKIALPNAKLVVPDEAHLTITDSREAIIEGFGEAITLGLTATPARADGKPLGKLYHRMVVGWSAGRMMAEGWLATARYFAPSEPDLKAVRLKKADYREDDLEQVMNTPQLVGDIVDNWLRLAEGKSTVVFCVNRAHARHVTTAFQAQGVSAEYVDGETPAEERAAIFARVERGETTVLCNVFVASYGLDIPPLAVCVLARPTKSLVLYLQMCGRVLRPLYSPLYPPEVLEESAELRLAAIADGPKPYSVIIDHAGAIDRHGFLDEDIPWTLTGDESISDIKDRQRAERKEPKEIKCPRCKAVFKGTRFCPKCGYEMVPPGKPLPTHEAELVEKVRDGNAANQKTPWTEKAAFMGEAKHYAASKGYHDGYASSLYRDKFGVWPNDPKVRDAAPRPPTAVLINFIKHKAMKKKKGRARA